jgi:hypothetical protein
VDAAERKLIFDLAGERVSIDAFIAQMGFDPRIDHNSVRGLLERALEEKSADDVEPAMVLAFRFGLSASWGPLLDSLLRAEWHTRHEDVASALQDIRDPSSVDCLFDVAGERHNQLAYLGYDKGLALARKCIWALHDIGTPAAKDKLRLLADSEIEMVRQYASKRLNDLAARRPEDPKPHYRRARDTHVRRD